MNNSKSYNALTLNIFIAFAICFTLFFGIQWYCLNNKLSEIKSQNIENYNKILSKKDFEPFQINFTQLKGKNVLINPNEIEKINNHIKVLSEQVYQESNRAESIIDKDIDRINLYMAIGIGFMTLLGIFVPILVNVLSVQDLRDKIREIPSKEIINDLSEKSNKALENSSTVNKLSQDIEKLTTKTDTTIPKMSTISLQIAINRLFNVSAIAISQIAKSHDTSLYKSLFFNVRNQLAECSNDELHKIHDNESLKQTLADFSLMLEEEKFKFTTFLNKRSWVENFDNLSVSLNELANSSENNEKQNCDITISILDAIIQSFE